ncbi:MAG TPA: hypothetical protein VLA79_12060 [Polyangia bacterium]|nr:hypothetical protein [Polyangia bacterium]
MAIGVSVLAGCGSKGAASDGGRPSTGSGGVVGGGGSGGNSGAATGAGGAFVDASAPVGGGPACPDLFDQNMVRTYSIDIDANEWASVMNEFNQVATLTASGNDFVVRHPVVFHMGSETVNNATLKLHGQSSWAQTATLDGNRAKIQFDISFHQSDPNGKFHGIEKLLRRRRHHRSRRRYCHIVERSAALVPVR